MPGSGQPEDRAMFTHARVKMIVRLVAGTALAAVVSRKLSLLVEHLAQNAFGEFDGTLLRWSAFALIALCGLAATLEWAGLWSDKASEKKAA